MINGNMTNNNINVDRSRFVLLFNSSLIRFVENALDKRNDDSIRYISELLVPDKSLGKVGGGNKPTHSTFKLPEDYFDLASAYATTSTESCSNIRLDLSEVKAEDVEEKYKDWSYTPSIKWREAFYVTSSGNLLVYRKDFDIEKVYLSYYRNPKPVDIKGYTHVDKSASTNIDPELSDKAVEKILRIMAKEVAANSGDSGQYQLDKDRLNSPV